MTEVVDDSKLNTNQIDKQDTNSENSKISLEKKNIKNETANQDLSELENLILKLVISRYKKSTSVTIFDIKIYLSKKYKLYVQHSIHILPILKKLRNDKIIFKEKDKYRPYDDKIQDILSGDNKEKQIDRKQWPYENN